MKLSFVDRVDPQRDVVFECRGNVAVKPQKGERHERVSVRVVRLPVRRCGPIGAGSRSRVPRKGRGG